MKHKLIILMMVLGCASCPVIASEKVRVFPVNANKKFSTGDMLEKKDLLYVLFTEKSCELPIADKRNIFSFVQFPGGDSMRRGCWYPTMDDGFVIIYGSGDIDKQPSWRMFPRGVLNSNGAVTITEPNYDSETFTKKVLDEKFNALMEMRRRGDY